MKLPRIRLIETMLVCSIVAMTVLACIVLAPLFVPPPLSFTSLDVAEGPTRVIAGTQRRGAEECTNVIHADLMNADQVVTRLPVPARTVKGSISVYPLVIPVTVVPGHHFVQVRETFLCAGRDPQVVESPWLPLEVR